MQYNPQFYFPCNPYPCNPCNPFENVPWNCLPRCPPVDYENAELLLGNNSFVVQNGSSILAPYGESTINCGNFAVDSNGFITIPCDGIYSITVAVTFNAPTSDQNNTTRSVTLNATMNSTGTNTVLVSENKTVTDPNSTDKHLINYITKLRKNDKIFVTLGNNASSSVTAFNNGNDKLHIIRMR